MKKIYLFLSLVCLGFLVPGAFAQTSTYVYTTGVVQNYTVPAGVSSISMDVVGAKGGPGYYGNQGAGGRVQVTLNVTPGQVYGIYIGNVGSTTGPNTGGLGGNGTGHVGGNGTSGSTWSGGGGGGSTEVWLSGAPIIIAGGGGGGSGDCSSDHGGQGGGVVGGNGIVCGSYSSTSCGTGGNTTAGTGGIAGSCGTASNGTLYNGGNAGSGTNWASGGGAGYYGGGGGCSVGAGGGGSSFPATAPTGNITAVSHSQGYNNTGSGTVIINVLCQAPGTVTGAASVCQGTTSTYTNPTGASGGTWTSSNTATGTISSTGVFTALAPGTTTITYVLSSPCGGTSASTSVTVLPAAAAIAGATTYCVGGTATLTDAVSGGTWTSSATGVATVGASTGVVNGISVGSATITYNPGNGCAVATVGVVVNAVPAAIGGTPVVCAGSTTTLSDATTGGTWSSSSPGIGSIDPSSGIMTGIAAGNPTITYTVAGVGCSVTKATTVNAASPITGSASICNGYTTLLSNGTPGGGTWVSSTPSVATISGTGLATSVSIGATTITFTATATGCIATLVVNVTAPPSPFTVTGGGAYCNVSGGGALVGLNGSNAGVSYSLYNGATLITTLTGTGAALNFGSRPAGTYTVVANFGTPCASTMLGSAIVTANPLPTAFAVTGGGSFCAGGTGAGVGLASSTIGVNYQLFLGSTPVGSPVAGTGAAISFGLQTSVGVYTVVATNTTTLCTNNMTGSAIISTNSLPTAFAVTGTGGFCLGGSGIPVGLSGSTIGTNYQLFLGGVPVGGLVSGTGAAISFGNQTSAGTYTVVATTVGTGCTNNMSGSAIVAINSLPTAFTVTGGGAYCSGGTGSVVGLNGSQVGVNYQLMNGTTAVGAPVPGTGLSISFGLQTTAGAYTVVATNATTACTSNMTGSASVSINPLPAVSSVTGGGSYCIGGVGVPVGLSGSTAGINYQLFNGATLIGAASGTGSALSFGNITVAGTYTVVATNATTTCVSNMAGSATVTINSLPAIFNVTNAGTGAYCAGGTGVVVGLSGSAAGVNYQLYNGTTPVGAPVAGTGVAISFGAQTGAGSYTVVAINPTTLCTSNMAGSALITINPLPTIYTMTGGGGYCAGGTGVNIGLAASNVGVNYQLYNTAGPVGSPVAGTGSAISFGLQTVASTRDSIVATNTATGCSSVMSGNFPVSINPLPAQYTVSGSGSYCAGGTGLNIFLGGSATGVNYQLFLGGTPVGSPVAGTNNPLVFGPVTTAGNYSIVATNAATSCVANMTGSATVIVNPLPTVFTVTGGGAYCATTAGAHVGLSSSVSGINYQLYNGVTPVGIVVPGNGLPLDFGALTAAGTYKVVAITPGSGCQSNMSGSVNITINPLPTAYTITQSAASYCAGGTGVHVGLSNSAVGVSYQLMNLGTPVGAPMLGTGSPLDFGLITAGGAYTIVATNSATGCTANMNGTATVIVNSLPALHTIIGGGSYCPSGSGVIVGLNGSNLGVSYQLFNGPNPVGAPVPGTAGLPISFGLQTGAGSYTVVATNTATSCVSNMAGSVTVSVNALPAVYNITGGGNYCIGGTGVNVGLSGSAAGVMYQLFDGSAPMGAPIAGTGSPISFGLQTTTGNYTVVASNVTTGCSATMFGSVTVGTNPLPAAFNVTGGGSYCSGGTGVNVGLDGSALGTNYQLLLFGTPVGTSVAGNGGPLNFGLKTADGSYSVVAVNTATTCTGPMAGNAVISINALPASFSLNGSGSYCTGGAGLEITSDGSDATASYQLFRGTTPVGIPVPGTGAGLSFGLQTTAGAYTVVATNYSNSCTANLAGTVNISINTPPTPFIVTGGGNYCAGGAGVHVNLSGSNTGVSYQLFVDGSPISVVMPGTGSAIDFGAMMGAGVYTIVGTNIASGCTNNMNGTATIGINPLPAAHTAVSTSSSYCAGGGGVEISLDGTDLGISYQLKMGTAPVGAAVDGTGGPVSFGFVTATGNYTIQAKNTATGCSLNMAPNVNVTISPLPAVFTITGGGQYCAGGAGVHIGLSNSNAGINYQLYRAGVPSGAPVAGTGTAIDFGLRTDAGAYTVVATNSTTTCTNNMSGTATVGINAVPAAYTVSGGGNYCAGGTGSVINLSNSAIGINYQLVRSSSPTGVMIAGTNTPVSFGPQTTAGTYSVMATNTITGCTSTMIGTAAIAVNPTPVAYNVTGGGHFCVGSAVTIGVANSATGITYQLYNSGVAVGTGVAGVSGAPISFGSISTPGIYSVIGTDNATGCANPMNGSATAAINPQPTVYNVVGGGNYCAGGTGVHVALSNSAMGINYTLYNNYTTLVTTLPGTGGPLDFGLQTAAGNYTVVAINPTTGCSISMAGSVNVDINPLVTPVVTVTNPSGDVVCAGSFITYSASAINGGATPVYQWSINGVAVASGATYGYIPNNGDVVGVTMVSSQACAFPASASNSMTMTVDANQLPAVTVSADPGTTVCQGTPVTFSATADFGGSAPAFTWVKNGVAAGTSASFTYTPADGDNVYCMLTSNYHCRLANTATSSHFNMNVDVPATPVVSITALPGANIAAGEIVTLVANITNAGPTPTIQWLVNGVVVPGANKTSFVSGSFANLDSITCQVLSSGGCSGLLGFNSITLHIAGVGVKPVTLSGSDLMLVPNPNNGTFTLKGAIAAQTNAQEDLTLEVVNMLGQVIYNQKVAVNNGEINERIQLSNALANGMYILNLHSGTENKVFHFVIEQ